MKKILAIAAVLGSALSLTGCSDPAQLHDAVKACRAISTPYVNPLDAHETFASVTFDPFTYGKPKADQDVDPICVLKTLGAPKELLEGIQSPIEGPQYVNWSRYMASFAVSKDLVVDLSIEYH